MDSGRAARSIPGRLARGATRARDRVASRMRPRAHGRAKTRWSRSCAAGSRVWDQSRQTALAAPLGLEPSAVAAALAALERDGAILKGRFLPGLNDEQWCDRRLLARIHHYTVGRLRAEIEPVAARDFLRFLFSWQHVAEDSTTRRPRCASCGLEHARRLRSAGKGMGDRDSPGAAQGLSGLVARQPMPRRADILGAFDAAGRRQRRRARAPCVAGRLHPDRAY